ncbi:MAG TPA: glutaminase [Trichocoleus sp.]|jgi:glutaminase
MPGFQKGITTLTDRQIQSWAASAKQQVHQGQVNGRIPQLAQSDPAWFAVQIENQQGCQFYLGDLDRTFPLMSVIKPFLLLFLLEYYSHDRVFEWVGREPSTAPFNSLAQLEADQGFPRNPMLNSGAIVLSEKLPGETSRDRCDALQTWLNRQAGCHLERDKLMLASVRSAGREPNQALAHSLQQAEHLTDPDITLDTYEQICCLAGRVADLAQLGRLMAFAYRSIAQHHQETVNQIMQQCGLYEASADYAAQIGMPIKSGISGALLTILPGQGVIACYSPALDPTGNSIAGLRFVELLCLSLGSDRRN